MLAFAKLLRKMGILVHLVIIMFFVSSLGLFIQLKTNYALVFISHILNFLFTVGAFIGYRKLINCNWSKKFFHLSSVALGFSFISYTLLGFMDILIILSPKQITLFLYSYFLLLFFACFKASWNLIKVCRLKQVNIFSSKLSNLGRQELNIIHLTDIHINLLTSKHWLTFIVNQVNSCHPDLILITGDLFHVFPEEGVQYVPLFTILKKLTARYGIYFVTGNHEEQYQHEDWDYIFKELPIKIVKNEIVKPCPGISIIGVDNNLTDNTKENKEKINKLHGVVNSDDFSIFLAHQPHHFELTAKNNIDLQLSGHLHAGQFPPYDLAVFLLFKYPYGLKGSNNSYIYTSSGVGSWEIPLRLFLPAEIVHIKVNSLLASTS